MRANLFVWNATEGIIRVLSFQIDNELGELVIMAEIVHRVLCNHISHRTLTWRNKSMPKAFQPIIAEKSR